MRVLHVIRLSSLFLLTACTGDLGIAETQREQRVANDPAAMTRIARAAEVAGDPASAEAFYQRAADLRPADGVVSISLARSLVEQGRNDAALDVLRNEHVRLPGNILVAATLGRLLVAVRRPRDALAAFEDGLHDDPQSVSLLIGRGVALDALGQHPAAQASYRVALAIAPQDVAARNNLALSLVLSGHADQAVEILRALRRASDPADAATVNGNLALAADAQARLDAASTVAPPTASDMLFPALPDQGGTATADGAGTVEAGGSAPP